MPWEDAIMTEPTRPGDAIQAAHRNDSDDAGPPHGRTADPRLVDLAEDLLRTVFVGHVVKQAARAWTDGAADDFLAHQHRLIGRPPDTTVGGLDLTAETAYQRYQVAVAAVAATRWEREKPGLLRVCLTDRHRGAPHALQPAAPGSTPWRRITNPPHRRDGNRP
jgi:hypothetical protein